MRRKALTSTRDKKSAVGTPKASIRKYLKIGYKTSQNSARGLSSERHSARISIRDVTYLRDSSPTLESPSPSSPSLPTDQEAIKRFALVSADPLNFNSRTQPIRCLKQPCVDSVLKILEDTPNSPQSVFKGSPPSRQDLSNLTSWFSKMKVCFLNHDLQSLNPSDQDERLVLHESILKIGINEFIRHIGIHCREKGNLLSDMFSSLVSHHQLVHNLRETRLYAKIQELQEQMELINVIHKRSTADLLQELEEHKHNLAEKQFLINAKNKKVERLKNDLNCITESNITMDLNKNSFFSTYLWEKPDSKLIGKLKPHYSRTKHIRKEVVDKFFTNQKTQTDEIPTVTNYLCLKVPCEDFTQQVDLIAEEESKIPNKITIIAPSETQEFSKFKNSNSLFGDTFLQFLAPEDFNMGSLSTIHKHAQTEKDLLLETEENSMIDEILKYKKNLINKADEDLLKIKGKIALLKEQQNLHSKRIDEEIQEVLPDTVEEYIQELISNTDLDNHDMNPWKRGFVKGVAFNKRISNSVSENDNSRKETSPIKKPPKISTAVKTSILSKRMMLKKMNFFYSAAVSCFNKGEKLLPLQEFIYQEISSQHHEVGIGNKKYKELIYAAAHHAKHPKAAVFLRLCELGHLADMHSFSRPQRLFTLYISLLTHMLRSKLGILLPIHDTGDEQLVPTLRAIDCIKEAFQDLLDSDTLGGLLTCIETMSKPDPIKVNSCGVISVDKVLETALEVYEQYQRDILDAVNIIINGLDNKDKIHYTEICMFVRHLTPDKLHLVERKAKLNFFVQIDDFVEMCVRKALFSMESVNNFLKGRYFSDAQAISNIHTSLIVHIETLDFMIDHGEILGISPEVQELWRTKIQLLYKDSYKHPKSIFLTFTVFINEIKRLRGLVDV